MTEESSRQNQPKRSRRKAIVWGVALCLLVGAGCVGIYVARRVRRAVQEAKQVRLLAKDLGNKKEVL